MIHRVPGWVFRAFLTQAMAANTKAGFVTVYDQVYYDRSRCYVTADWAAGCAVSPNNELFSVWRRPGAPQGAGEAMIAAVLGDTDVEYLECFDVPALTSLYTRLGFVESERFDWDEESSPENWNAADGRPDYLVMRHVGAMEEAS